MDSRTSIVPALSGETALLDRTARMRASHAVWQAPDGTWHVFGHAEVRAVPGDPAAFSSDLASVEPGLPPRGPGMLTQLLGGPARRSSRIPAVIEETTRYRPSFPALQRATTAPVHLGGAHHPRSGRAGAVA